MSTVALDFDQLAQENHTRLVNYAASIIGHDQAAAEDAAQEAWATAWEQRGRYVDRGIPPLAWLQTLTRYSALALIRPRNTWAGPVPRNPTPSTLVGQLLDHMPNEGWGSPPGLSDPETRSRLAEVVPLLSVGQADCIELYCVRGYSYAEAAERLGVDVRTVRSQVSVGLARIRRYFLGDGHSSARDCRLCGWPGKSVGHRSSCGSGTVSRLEPQADGGPMASAAGPGGS